MTLTLPIMVSIWQVGPGPCIFLLAALNSDQTCTVVDPGGFVSTVGLAGI
jgi:hypothetical protein